MMGFGVVVWVGWGVMGRLVLGWVLGVEKKMYMERGVIMIMGVVAKRAMVVREYGGKGGWEGMSV